MYIVRTRYQHIPNIFSLSAQLRNPYSGRTFITKGIPSFHVVRYLLTFSHCSSHQLPFFHIVNYVTDGKQKCIHSTKGTNSYKGISRDMKTLDLRCNIDGQVLSRCGKGGPRLKFKRPLYQHCKILCSNRIG